jgi:urea transporter/murein DD-endopeptidase MepM/ murein hydrolase activator NlpD
MKTGLKKINTHYGLNSILNSYSLIFFSNHKLFALLILSVSFFTPSIGIFGLLSIILINSIAYNVGFNREDIKSGLFGFNALFLGMALAHDYSINSSFLILFLFSILTLLLITVWFKGLLGNYQLPFLSIPFVVTYWIVQLAASNLSKIQLNESGVYVYNELAINQQSLMFQFIHSLDNMLFPDLVITFFKTLSGIFFQSSLMAGIIIAFGLLFVSRISFTLAVIGFMLAYFFYYLFGANVNDLNYNLFGANFIFLAIAIGCFFLIPNKYSYLAVIIIIPILLLFTVSLNRILALFWLQSYSLSFSIITTAFLFVLNQRFFLKFLHIPAIQYFSAEKTIYKYLNSLQRFKNEHLYKLSLPFAGEWFVSQAYDGNITHLGDWSKALDFVIVDSKNKTYREPASRLDNFIKENFYCYNKEIYAPLDGYVYDIINNVEENDVGEVNTENNWGNTVIINHLNGLFSQTSHIKKDSIGVYIGQYIYRGTYIGTCGNSGRSPEPHIHFQLQTIPIVGAKTLAYPFGYFIERIGTEKYLRISEVPSENSFISNVQLNQLLLVAYSFYPGQKIQLINNKTKEEINWEVLTDAYNRIYIYCKETESNAYFVCDGVMLYFTDFEGDKNSLLFKFYLGLYRQLMGYYENIMIEDKIPLIHFNNKLFLTLQDFLAPFYLFTRAEYNSTFIHTDNIYAPQYIQIKSNVTAKFMGSVIKQLDFEIHLKDSSIDKFFIHDKSDTEEFNFKIK